MWRRTLFTASKTVVTAVRRTATLAFAGAVPFAVWAALAGPALGGGTFSASVLRTHDLSAVVPPSADPTGIAFVPARGTLLVVDSEIEETVGAVTHYAGANLWELTLDGAVVRTADLSRLAGGLGITDEPTGIAVDLTTGRAYVTDDDAARVYALDPGPDALVATADDLVTWFSTASAGNTDPEGIAVDPSGSRLYVADANGAEIYVYTPAGVPEGHFDVAAYGVDAPESIEFDGAAGTLLVPARKARLVAEVSTDGALFRLVDAAPSATVAVSALTLLPPGAGTTEPRLLLVDRGVDNNADPAAIDGRLVELTAPPTAAPVGRPLTVDAGADLTVVLPNAVALVAAVADDALPAPATALWSQEAGPALATIADPAAGSTTVSFTAPGMYVLRLTATDGEWLRVDELTVSVRPEGSPDAVDLPLAAPDDDAEERGALASSPFALHLSSADLDLMNDVGTAGTVTMGAVGLRFTGIPVPPGQIVTNATIQLTADRAGNEPTAYTIRAEAADDAAPFAHGLQNITARPTTVAAVPWTPPPWLAAGEATAAERTPDLAALLQEVVGRPGWKAGNALAFVVTGDAVGGRVARSAESARGGRAVLHLEWQPVNANRPPVVAITAPVTNAVVAATTVVTFAATADDPEDGALADTLQWTSTIDGPLGVGGTLLTGTLTPGTHVVTARATDSGGASASASITLTVLGAFPEPTAQLLAAGDVASCGWRGDELTAALLDGLDGPILTLGDNVYPDGTPAQFASCYEPTWGRHKARTYPVPGNHDYHTPGGSGYFEYFGTRAGEPGAGYYSFDLGGWHIVALNSEIAMGAGSAQEQWLRADLAAHPVTCTLAYWHEPRFGSGVTHGNDTRSAAVWRDLYATGADVVLNGHEHKYERFAPQSPAGLLDPNGITQFIVGTAGSINGAFDVPVPNSLVRDASSLGVLRLTLRPTSFDWEFLSVPGGTNHDAGSAACVRP